MKGEDERTRQEKNGQKQADLWAENNRNKARVQKAINELKWISEKLEQVAPQCWDSEDIVRDISDYCKDAIKQIEKEVGLDV